MVQRRIRRDFIRLIFRTRAVQDLREIARYTKHRWGVEQAAAYADGLRHDIKSLLEFPLRCPAVDAREDGIRKMRSGHHMVYYLAWRSRVEIIRVLHESADIEDKLNG
jgi:toxin ParE1/3/4